MEEWLMRNTDKRRQRNNNQTEKDSGYKGKKKKDFTTKEQRDKNIVIIKTKLTMNFKFLYHYVEKKGYLFCEFKAFRVIS